MSVASAKRPTIALFPGDPAGVGPEIMARLLADPHATEHADILIIGSRESLRDGMRSAGCRFEFEEADAPKPSALPVLLRTGASDATGFARGEVSAKSGAYMLQCLAQAVALWKAGHVQALCFAPLNKAALRAGGMDHPDELHWFAEQFAFEGTCVELNVLESLWTSRVTSHVALADVSALITREKVAEMVALMTESLRRAGKPTPRVAVCGLNPHNGDGGAYGREEIEVIEPGVALARSRGYPADGPFPADTIFVRATRPKDGYDGVVTMYHDQGQIAMKLLGFERGVTVQGGLPMPITTPAHGTAYDIAGQGKANAGAMRNAFSLTCEMSGALLPEKQAVA